MFEIRTEDTRQLKRIVAAGAGALILGLIILALNLVAPAFAGGYDLSNFFFVLFGILVVIFATHPTYQAAVKLDEK